MSSQTDPFAQLAALFMTEGDAPTPAPTIINTSVGWNSGPRLPPESTNPPKTEAMTTI